MDEYLVSNWRDKIVYAPDGPKPQILIEDKGFRALIAGLEAGQKIPPHPEGAAMFHFVEGTGWMIVGDKRLRVQPGATVVAPAGGIRGVEAETRLAFIAARYNEQPH